MLVWKRESAEEVLFLDAHFGVGILHWWCYFLMRVFLKLGAWNMWPYTDFYQQS